MARPSFVVNPKRVNIFIEGNLLRKCRRKAKLNGFHSFADYVARLLVADYRREHSDAHSNPRSLLVKRG